MTTETPLTSMPDPLARDEVEARLVEEVHGALPATIADLSRLVRIPSVAWTGFDHAHVQASAEAVAALFEGTGVFDRVSIERSRIGDGETLGQPAVLASRAARNGKPTVLLYAHHDVQPPGDDAGWNSPPYEPTLRGERLYGRGAADDKAGVMAHVASIRALVEVLGPDFDLGLAVFVEGEEEFGSRSFPNFLVDHRDALAADAIVVADSGNWSTTVPALTVGLRGNVKVRLTVSTLDHASHSGMFGGAVPDAMMATVRLLDSFWHEDGSVAVDGLTSREAETPAYDEAQLRDETGLLDGVSPIGTGTILGRIWNSPSVTVTGIDAPSVQNASNTLVPSVKVVVSCRIAPGQTSEHALAAIEAHVAAHTPWGAHVVVDEPDRGDPFLVDASGWAAAEALGAMRDAFGGAEPVQQGVGGSIPFIADLVRVFPEAQILVTGVEDPDSRAHSPNESLHLGSFHRSVLSETLLLSRLSRREG